MEVPKAILRKIPYYRSAILDDVKERICDADLLLWLPLGLYGRAICAASGSVHSHAGIAAWVTLASGKRDLLSLDTREGVGGHAHKLSTLVRQFPGIIAWYKANHIGIKEFNPQAVVDAFWDNVLGAEYGTLTALKMGLQRAFLLRFLIQPNHDDLAVSPLPDVCSGAVSRWTREAGGVDPVLGMADDSTWPAHLETSFFYKYQAHLFPVAGEKGDEST